MPCTQYSLTISVSLLTPHFLPSSLLPLVMFHIIVSYVSFSPTSPCLVFISFFDSDSQKTLTSLFWYVTKRTSHIMGQSQISGKKDSNQGTVSTARFRARMSSICTIHFNLPLLPYPNQIANFLNK